MHDEAAKRPCPVHEVVPSVAQHERRTRWVVGITATMMVAELIVGTLTKSLVSR